MGSRASGLPRLGLLLPPQSCLGNSVMGQFVGVGDSFSFWPFLRPVTQSLCQACHELGCAQGQGVGGGKTGAEPGGLEPSTGQNQGCGKGMPGAAGPWRGGTRSPEAQGRLCAFEGWGVKRGSLRLLWGLWFAGQIEYMPPKWAWQFFFWGWVWG